MEHTTNLNFARAVVKTFNGINARIRGGSEEHIGVKIDNNFNLVFVSNNTYIHPTTVEISSDNKHIIAEVFPEGGSSDDNLVSIRFKFDINNYERKLIYFIDLLAYYKLIGDEMECQEIRKYIESIATPDFD